MTFRDKANRDAAVRDLRSRGELRRVYSMRNQSLSPSYVVDDDRPTTPNMFGGAAVRYYPVLYCLDRA